MTSRGKRLAPLALFAALVFAAGCANIPDENQPAVVSEKSAASTPKPPEPRKDANPLDLVRSFVGASAQPTKDYLAARVYLDEVTKQNWRPDRGLTIIEDTFGTVYAVDGEQPSDPNEQIVMLRGFNVGRLGADSAFIPVKTPYEQPVRVRRQPDGQWRIVAPPNTVVITESNFNANYFRVPLYFFAPDTNALVPDLRYVAAQPQNTLPDRVVHLLLSGPSEGLAGAVRSPLGDQTRTETNVTTSNDGALVVPLSGLSGQSDAAKKDIVAQIVLSLQNVTSSRIRLQSDGSPLVPGKPDWRPVELPSYDALTVPKSELPGLLTAGGRIRMLDTDAPIPGPAGAGAYNVFSAAQSVDGRQLAIVERAGEEMRLRIGEFGGEAPVVDLHGRSLTRPTWRPAASAVTGAGEVWTVRDGSQVVRLSKTPEGGWAPQSVNAAEITAVGPITALRLSRDGVRAAVVAGGHLVVASVVRAQDSVTLRAPRILQGGELNEVVDVDWASQDTLVAATFSTSLPVARLPVDGLRMDPFNSSNLTPPVRSLTAAPGRRIVVADAGGLWEAQEVGEVWRPHPVGQAAVASPFYPG